MEILIRTIAENFPLLITATLITAIGSAVSILVAMAIAVPTAFARISHNVLLRSISTFYVETIRGTPLLLQLLVWFYGARFLLLYLFNFNADIVLYNILTALNSNTLMPSVGIANIFFAVVGLAFNYGAYLSEIIRAGVEAVDPGQVEASAVLGLSALETARYITLPQALRIMIPPITNTFVILVQDSSFWLVLGVFELTNQTYTLTQSISISNGIARWGLYGLELAIYFVICYSMALASRRIESQLSRGVAGAN